MKRLFAIVLLCVLVPCAYGGTSYYDNGDKYVGEVRNGKKHGQGTYTFTDGSIVVGDWKKLLADAESSGKKGSSLKKILWMIRSK